MARKLKKVLRPLFPDQKYQSLVVSKFINHLMESGKKALATKIVYTAMESLEIVAKEKQVNPLDLFLSILESVRPKMKMKARRVGGATYQVPKVLAEGESEMLAMKWLIDAAQSMSGKSMSHGLKITFLETLEGRGNAIKKKEEMHRTAEANKAFAHFA
jgi:small subunit ribosomal protein S7